MTHQEQHRLRRILEYNKGYADALAFVLDDNPSVEKMDYKLEIVQDRIKDLERKLKKSES
jgi:hypothetical protein